MCECCGVAVWCDYYATSVRQRRRFTINIIVTIILLAAVGGMWMCVCVNVWMSMCVYTVELAWDFNVNYFCWCYGKK